MMKVQMNLSSEQNFSEIYRFFLLLGITPNYLGFYQAAYAVALCMKEPERLISITKSLYPDVAKNFRTSVGSVERNIRTVARISWDSHSKVLSDLSSESLQKQPTVSQFLSLIVFYFLYSDCKYQ